MSRAFDYAWIFKSGVSLKQSSVGATGQSRRGEPRKTLNTQKGNRLRIIVKPDEDGRTRMANRKWQIIGDRAERGDLRGDVALLSFGDVNVCETKARKTPNAARAVECSRSDSRGKEASCALGNCGGFAGVGCGRLGLA